MGRPYKFLHQPLLAGLIFFVMAVFLQSCSTESDSGCDPGIPCIPAQGPHANLSDYGFFKGDLKQLEPVDALLPYDLNTELFSDYSQKLRMVYIPDNQSVTLQDGDEPGFPVGTVLIKNFFYEHDLQDETKGRTILETRLLIHREEGWTAETYVWNEDQSEAELHRTGAKKAISWNNEKGIPRSVEYVIPTVNDCRNCHGGNKKLTPLGPTLSNLNRSFSYRDGESNQLTKWKQKGFLTENTDPATTPKLPSWDDPASGTLNERARAYLAVNCANCHSPTGSAGNSALFLEYDQEDSFHLGVCKPPVAAGSGAGDLSYNIVPGKPGKSILFYRMNSVKPQVRMPEIGRTLIHEEAVELIREWIEKMDEPVCAE